MTNYKEAIKSVDWVTTNPAAKKYGDIDISKITASGQSCGGLESYDAALNDPRIKLIVEFNSGYLSGATAQSMARFKVPIAITKIHLTFSLFMNLMRDQW